MWVSTFHVVRRLLRREAQHPGSAAILIYDSADQAVIKQLLKDYPRRGVYQPRMVPLAIKNRMEGRTPSPNQIKDPKSASCSGLHQGVEERERVIRRPAPRDRRAF
jgi:hypothetical protein